MLQKDYRCRESYFKGPITVFYRMSFANNYIKVIECIAVLRSTPKNCRASECDWKVT